MARGPADSNAAPRDGFPKSDYIPGGPSSLLEHKANDWDLHGRDTVGGGKNNRQKEFFPTRKTSGCASYVCHETAPLLAPIPIQADRPTTLSATSNLYSPRSRYCVAHECRDRRRDRNILLSKRFPGGSLKGGRSPCAARSTQLQGVIGKQVGGSGVLCPQGPQRRSRATTWDISAKRSLPKSRRRGAFSEVSAEIVPSWI